MWPNKDAMASGLGHEVLIELKYLTLVNVGNTNVLKKEMVSIWEGVTVKAVTDSLVVEITVLARELLTQSILLLTVSHILPVIDMMYVREGLLSSA